MMLFRIILAFIIFINVAFILFASYNTRNLTTTTPYFESSNTHETLSPESSRVKYAFKDPVLAYQILQKLDILEPEYNMTFKKTYDFVGLIADDDYCDKHRAYFVHNPSYVFTDKNHITSYPTINGFRKTVLGVMGTNVMPQIRSRDEDKLNENPQPLATNISLFAMHIEMFFYRSVMKQYSCLGQMSNHIPGHDSLYRKDDASLALREYGKRYTTRPQCFNLDRFFPKTFTMRSKEQCEDFFKEFNSKQYTELKKQRKIVYFRKIGANVHAAYGIFPVNEEEEKYIRELYDNGKKCGKVRENNLMQYFVHNPLLLNGKKFDFRLFMLIASSNPFIVYYHDGLLRVSLTDYATEGNVTNTLMPNGRVNDEIIYAARDEGSFMGKTKEEMVSEYLWNFDKFQKYLLEKGIITDPNWLDNYLRPTIKKAMIHLIRMSQKGFFKISSVFELFGLDFMLDEELNLWFVEGNCRPAVESLNDYLKHFFMKMYSDQYDIVFSILRSRMKRVYNYVNNLIISEQVIRINEQEIELVNYDQKLKEFKEASKNFIDPEFEVNKTNEFVKIIDENYKGSKMYMDLIPEECL